MKMWDFTKTRPTPETLRAAIQEAANGGQGLMVHAPIPVMSAPECFKRAKLWGKLYDQNAKRLVETAQSLGVNVRVLHHLGTPRQHIDLCGGPLMRAMRQADAVIGEASL